MTQESSAKSSFTDISTLCMRHPWVTGGAVLAGLSACGFFAYQNRHQLLDNMSRYGLNVNITGNSVGVNPQPKTGFFGASSNAGKAMVEGEVTISPIQGESAFDHGQKNETHLTKDSRLTIGGTPSSNP